VIGPELGRALCGWLAFIVVVAGAGLLVAPADSPAFALSALMLAVGLLAGAVLAVAVRLAGRRR
jgi:hypothetical protein